MKKKKPNISNDVFMEVLCNTVIDILKEWYTKDNAKLKQNKGDRKNGKRNTRI